jgi:hypothetical protein
MLYPLASFDVSVGPGGGGGAYSLLASFFRRPCWSRRRMRCALSPGMILSASVLVQEEEEVRALSWYHSFDIGVVQEEEEVCSLSWHHCFDVRVGAGGGGGAHYLLVSFFRRPSSMLVQEEEEERALSCCFVGCNRNSRGCASPDVGFMFECRVRVCL